MLIKLIQTGGFLPLTKEASTEVEWSKEETDELIALIEIKGEKDSHARDAIYHILEVNGREISIDLSLIPLQYCHIFADMKKNLAIRKF